MDVASLVLASHEHWQGHGGEWWPIFPLLWFILIFGTIFFFARRGCGRRHHRSSGESLLGERYARGEIDEREYRERLEVLRTIRESKGRSA